MDLKKDRRVNILIVGFGLIGKERFNAIKKLKLSTNEDIDIIDPNLGKEIESTPNFKTKEIDISGLRFIKLSELKKSYDFMIISAPHLESTEFLISNSNLSDKILVEKPMGVTLDKTNQIHKISSKNKLIYAGFNYRFFEPIQKLASDLKEHKFGDIINVSIKLGLGHQPGSENTWRLDKNQIPYGCLTDPGIHILDLINHLFGELENIKASAWSGFWNKNYYEDVQFLGTTAKNANLNCSISNVSWKSTFSIIVNGTKGYGQVSGRGRSYGIQRYIVGKRWGWSGNISQGDTEEVVSESDCENSFIDEIKDIIINKNNIAATSEDGLKAMTLLYKIDEAIVNKK